MRIVIAGAGEVGTHLAKMLSNEKHDIVVIDHREEMLRNIASTCDLLTISGNADSLDTLKEANIKKAELYIAVTESESVNLLSCIVSKRMGAQKTIARINNQQYLEPGNREHFISLGLDYMVFPESIAAKEISDLLHQTGTTDLVEFAGGKMSLYVVKLDIEAPIIGKSLNEVSGNTKHLDFRAVAITRNNETIIPRGDDVFQIGDYVYAMSGQVGLEQILKMTGKEHSEARNVMILGGSRIGKLAAENLGYHHNIKIIELSRERSYALSNQLKNVLVICGDGRNMDLLSEEKIENMDAFVAVTGNSETNILACIHAKRLGVRKTIAEVENFSYFDLASNLGVDSIVNKKLSAASRIFRFTTAGVNVSSVKCLYGTDAEVLEFVVAPESKITKAKISALGIPQGSIIGGIVRGKDVIIPTGETVIMPNDRVVAFALPAAIRDLSKLFQNKIMTE